MSAAALNASLEELAKRNERARAFQYQPPEGKKALDVPEQYAIMARVLLLLLPEGEALDEALRHLKASREAALRA